MGKGITRRGFLEGLIGVAGTHVLASCDSKPRTIAIHGNNYEVSNNGIKQLGGTRLEKIGLVSDIEGAIKNAEISADELKLHNVSAVIVAGDNYENEEIRRRPLYPNSKNNLREMVEGIQPFARLNIPVLIISGNHETKSVYNDAMDEIGKNYKNVLDINNKSVDLQGFNIVGMGGYHHPRFTAQGGFLLNKEDYERAFNNLRNFQAQREPTIFVTHGPPKAKTKIDYVKGVGHVGDLNIARIMNSGLKNVTNVHGHIHEGGGNFDKYLVGNAFNVASITDFMRKGANTSLMTVRNGQVEYSEIN